MRYVIVVAALGLALGSLWEIAEWLYVRSVPSALDKADTMSDLVWDATGAMLAALYRGLSVEASARPRSSARRG